MFYFYFCSILKKKAGEFVVIGIIGAGASGMTAAIAASENTNAEIYLFERQARVGRKLQATGNGRCNLSNIHALSGGYHGEDATFADAALQMFDPEMTLSWFRTMGLYTVTEATGRVYPYSDQANSVVDVLRFTLNKPNIHLYTGCEVRKAQREQEGFRIFCEQDSFYCDKLIIACGGLAGSKLGGSMSGYQLLAKFGHRSTKLRPALVQIKTSWSGVAALKGVRANCCATIYKDDEAFSCSEGELQFTEFGLSGPVIFEISRDVCYEKGLWSCKLDFMPHVSEQELYKDLCSRCERNIPTEEFLTGMLHNRLGRILSKAAGIQGGRSTSELTDEQLAETCRKIKNFTVLLSEPLGMDSAQVTAGGVFTNGFVPETMESRFIPGLYACGEVLDIDGDCGGYNLQWAWSSGRLAGVHAGGKL